MKLFIYYLIAHVDFSINLIVVFQCRLKLVNSKENIKYCIKRHTYFLLRKLFFA